jgi:transposase
MRTKRGAYHEQTPQTESFTGIQVQVALAAVKGEHSITEFYQRFYVNPNQITQWKTQLLEQAPTVFEQGGSAKEPSVDIKTLHAKIGELALENDFLEGALTKAGLLSAKK